MKTSDKTKLKKAFQDIEKGLEVIDNLIEEYRNEFNHLSNRDQETKKGAELSDNANILEESVYPIVEAMEMLKSEFKINT